MRIWKKFIKVLIETFGTFLINLIGIATVHLGWLGSQWKVQPKPNPFNLIYIICTIFQTVKFGFKNFFLKIFLGKLIAIGVDQIINIGIFSRAFYYDPIYEYLNLGTYSGLIECFFVRKFNFTYFILGCYIHSYVLFLILQRILKIFQEHKIEVQSWFSTVRTVT